VLTDTDLSPSEREWIASTTKRSGSLRKNGAIRKPPHTQRYFLPILTLTLIPRSTQILGSDRIRAAALPSSHIINEVSIALTGLSPPERAAP